MNTQPIYAAILAGGNGTRMGNIEKPKQFLEIGHKPILIHTIEKFLLQNEIERIMVLTPKAWLQHSKDIIRKYIGETERIIVIEGGSSRHETIMNAIRYIEEYLVLNEETILVTHDAVRPFVSSRIITENIKMVQEHVVCDTVVPAVDTMVQSLDGKVIYRIPNRAELYNGQTPQTFRAKRLKEINASLSEEEKKTLTDACKIFSMKGESVYMVQGDVCNIKITYPNDLRVAESLFGGSEEC